MLIIIHCIELWIRWYGLLPRMFKLCFLRLWTTNTLFFLRHQSVALCVSSLLLILDWRENSVFLSIFLALILNMLLCSTNYIVYLWTTLLSKHTFAEFAMSAWIYIGNPLVLIFLLIWKNHCLLFFRCLLIIHFGTINRTYVFKILLL